MRPGGWPLEVLSNRLDKGVPPVRQCRFDLRNGRPLLRSLMNASKRKYLILIGIACLAVILALVLRREETLE
ncbi:MAG: hypothetical protein D6724_07210, partial [Armatimonadetes bacterium]